MAARKRKGSGEEDFDDFGLEALLDSVDDSTSLILGRCISKGAQESAYLSVSVNGTSFKMDDSVMYLDEKRVERPGRLSAIFVPNSGKVVQVEITRFVHPEETPTGRKAFHKPRELLRSNQNVVTDASRLIRHCTIETKKEFDKNAHRNEDTYFFVDFFDFYSGKVSSKPPEGDTCRSIRRTWLDKVIEDSSKPQNPKKPSPPAPFEDAESYDLDKELDEILNSETPLINVGPKSSTKSPRLQKISQRTPLLDLSSPESKEISKIGHSKASKSQHSSEKKLQEDLEFATPASRHNLTRNRLPNLGLSSPLIPSQYSQLSSLESSQAPFAPSPIQLSPFKAEKTKQIPPLNLNDEEDSLEVHIVSSQKESNPIESDDMDDMDIGLEDMLEEKGRLVKSLEKVKEAESEEASQEINLKANQSQRPRLRRKSEIDSKPLIRIDINESSAAESSSIDILAKSPVKASGTKKRTRSLSHDEEDEDEISLSSRISARTRKKSKDIAFEEDSQRSSDDEAVSKRTRRQSKDAEDELEHDLSLDSIPEKIPSKVATESPPTKKRRLSDGVKPEVSPPSRNWTSPRENAGSKETKLLRRQMLTSYPKVGDLGYDRYYPLSEDDSNQGNDDKVKLDANRVEKKAEEDEEDIPKNSSPPLPPKPSSKDSPEPTKPKAKSVPSTPSNSVHLVHPSKRVASIGSKASIEDRMIASAERFSNLSRTATNSTKSASVSSQYSAKNIDPNFFRPKKKLNLSKTLPPPSSMAKVLEIHDSDDEEVSSPRRPALTPALVTSPVSPKVPDSSKKSNSNSYKLLKEQLLKESPPTSKPKPHESLPISKASTSISSSSSKMADNSAKKTSSAEDLLDGISTQALLDLDMSGSQSVETLLRKVQLLKPSSSNDTKAKAPKPSKSLVQSNISHFFSQSPPLSQEVPKKVTKKRKRVEAFPEDSDDSEQDESDPAAKKRQEARRAAKRRQKLTKTIFDDNAEAISSNDSLNDFIVADDAELSQEPEVVEDDGSSMDIEEANEADVEGYVNDMIDLQNITLSSRTLSLKKSFEIFVQYLLSHVLDPEDFDNILEGKSSAKNYYIGPVQRIEDEVLGKNKALMSSSAWNEDFKFDLDRFPGFRVFKEDHEFAVEGVQCQACHRKNHSATVLVQLEGPPYDARRFWNGQMIDNPSEEAESAEVTYRLGKHCCHRSRLYHSFQHYKYFLYTRLKKEVAKVQEEDPDLESGEIVQQLLDKRGWLEKYYSEFKEMTESARNYAIEEKGV